MYELMILAHLMRGPAHGYLIAKIINGVIGPYARVSNGRLYPLLAKLEQAGLIEVDTQDNRSSQGDRQLRTYRITEAGKQRFYILMIDTNLSPGDYQKIFWQKSCFLDLLEPLERLRVIDHYLNYCQTHILHITAEAEDFVQRSPHWRPERKAEGIESVLGAMQHMIKQWELELDWAKSLKAKELVRSQAESGSEEKRSVEECIRKED
jgi:DNA-binding PadR family transcriptional regulator